jgi:hypothetical protein
MVHYKLAMLLITGVLAVLSLTQVSHGYTIKKIECTSNPSICLDKVCLFNYTKEEPKVYHVFMGCKLKEPINKMSVSRSLDQCYLILIVILMVM